jgi:hypothetical protein
MAKDEGKMVRVHPLTNSRLGELEAALESDIGVTASYGDIVGALVHATTAPALAILLPVYKRYTARLSAGSEKES